MNSSSFFRASSVEQMSYALRMIPESVPIFHCFGPYASQWMYKPVLLLFWRYHSVGIKVSVSSRTYGRIWRKIFRKLLNTELSTLAQIDPNTSIWKILRTRNISAISPIDGIVETKSARTTMEEKRAVDEWNEQANTQGKTRTPIYFNILQRRNIHAPKMKILKF